MARILAAELMLARLRAALSAWRCSAVTRNARRLTENVGGSDTSLAAFRCFAAGNAVTFGFGFE
jgi:hypothetical protein